MKRIIIFTLFISTQLLANYAFNTNNKKIDMHGGKSEKLTDSSNRFLEMKMNSVNGLKDISNKNSLKTINITEKPAAKKKKGNNNL